MLSVLGSIYSFWVLVLSCTYTVHAQQAALIRANYWQNIWKNNINV